MAAKEGAFSEGTCRQCGQCIEVCHANARTWMGESMSVDEVTRQIKKDQVFYRRSFGGVTFSGGEPLLQPVFLKEMLDACRKLGIHTAIETCGYFDWEAAKPAIVRVDYILCDIKHMDDERHREITGVSHRRILENAEKMNRLGIPMVIRIPIIPSVNDSEDNIRATAAFVREQLPGVVGIELLPYHSLGLVKYAALGRDYTLDHIRPPDDGHMQNLRELIKDEGVCCITDDSGYAPDPAQSKIRLVG